MAIGSVAYGALLAIALTKMGTAAPAGRARAHAREKSLKNFPWNALTWMT
jgi:hypothetical protein